MKPSPSERAAMLNNFIGDVDKNYMGAILAISSVPLPSDSTEEYFVDFLEKNISSINSTTDGKEHLFIAAREALKNNHTKTFNKLLEMMVDNGAEIEELASLTYFAAACGNLEAIDALISKTSKPEVLFEKRGDKLSPLEVAFSMDNVEVVVTYFLYPMPSNVNISQLVSTAVIKNNTDMTRMLLTAGGSWSDGGLDASLSDAVYYGNIEIINLLLDHGANINQLDDRGDTLIHYAASHSSSEVIDVLASRGLSLHLVNKSGDTPLHSAAYHNNIGAIDVLVKHYELDINQVDKYGRTPLHKACAHKKQEAFESLLKLGADVRADLTTSEAMQEEWIDRDMAAIILDERKMRGMSPERVAWLGGTVTTAIRSAEARRVSPDIEASKPGIT